MSRQKDIAVFVGSLRKDSFNRKIANALVQLAPAELKLEIVPIEQLPFYNQDLETATPPPAWAAFRSRVKSADGVLFITPEYNRSTPAPLKNAIDVGSRPYGQSVWAHKPGAVLSSSIGAIGGFGANHHLRQSLVFLDIPVMQQPEAYVSNADKLFDEAGQLTNEATRDFLTQYIKSYAKWVERILA